MNAKYMLPDNQLGKLISGILCRVFHRHSLFCRGRRDHVRDGKVIDPGRWFG
jgi:hypothetical protein